MTSGKIVGKTVDRIFDVEGEDGTVIYIHDIHMSSVDE